MFSSKKETLVRENILQHLEQTQNCLLAAQQTFTAFVTGHRKETTQAFDHIKESERAGDRLRREIYRLLSEGAFLPILRADLHKLVALIDELNDLAENISDMIISERPKLPKKFYPQFEEIFIHTLHQFNLLSQLLRDFLTEKEESPAEISERIATLSQMEHEVGELEWQLTIDLFKSRLALANKMHIKQLLTRLSLISNKIEDIGDTLAELVVKLQV